MEEENISTTQIADSVYESTKNKATSSSQPCLAILVGLPFAGKSTVAELLQKKDFVHLWATVIKKEYGIKDAEMLQVSLDVCGRLLQENKRVVFDFLNHTEELRRPFIELARNRGISCKVIYLDTQKEELMRRQEAVERTGGSVGRSQISREVIEIVLDELEEPEDNESLIGVKDGDTAMLHQWLHSLN